MKMAAALATLVLLMVPAIASAQASDSERYASVPWRPDLIAAYESNGGQNIPNFRFDGVRGTHSAGGVCQMLTHTWERVAPTIDIDMVKFPVAGAASEFDQWRACWKLWSMEGYVPWTCCNTKIRAALERAGVDAVPPRRVQSATASRSGAARSVATQASGKSPETQSRVEWYSARLAASSDVYHAEFRAPADDIFRTGAAGR